MLGSQPQVGRFATQGGQAKAMPLCERCGDAKDGRVGVIIRIKLGPEEAKRESRALQTCGAGWQQCTSMSCASASKLSVYCVAKGNAN